MNRRILILFILVCFLSLLSCSPLDKATPSSKETNTQAKKIILDPQTSSHVANSAFYGSDFVWLVHVNGVSYRTLDGGKHWNSVTEHPVSTFEAVSFISSQRGWAISEGMKIWSTTDSGNQWHFLTQLPTAELSSEFYERGVVIKFFDEFHGWLLSNNAIWNTSDGGKIWNHEYPMERVLANRHQWDDANYFEQDIYKAPTRAEFFSPSVAWLAGNGLIYMTPDGGRRWSAYYLNKHQEGISSMCITSPQIGWAATWAKAKLYNTLDGGQSWNQVKLPASNLIIYSLQFFNEREGFVVGAYTYPDKDPHYQGVILYTLNGGEQWEEIKINHENPVFDKIHFTDNKTGWLFNGADIFRTEDGGIGWQKVYRFSQ